MLQISSCAERPAPWSYDPTDPDTVGEARICTVKILRMAGIVQMLHRLKQPCDNYSYAHRKRTRATQPRTQVGYQPLPTSVATTAPTAGPSQSHHGLVPAHIMLAVYCHPICVHSTCCLWLVFTIHITIVSVHKGLHTRNGWPSNQNRIG